MRIGRAAGSVAAAAAVALLLTGCGSSTAAPTGTGGPASSAPAVTYASGSAGAISLTDGWISDAGMSGMSGMSAGHSGGSGGSGGELAAYAVIHDRGAIADRLVSVQSPAARRVDLHTTVEHDSAGTMRQVSGFDLPAGGEIRFQIGGSHVMLSGLRHTVQAGMRIPLVLTFASGTVLHVTFPVISPEDRPGL